MSMKTIPIKRVASQVPVNEPQTFRERDANSLVMNKKPPQPSFDTEAPSNYSMPNRQFEEKKYETLKMNHVNSSVQGQTFPLFPKEDQRQVILPTMQMVIIRPTSLFIKLILIFNHRRSKRSPRQLPR